MIIEVRWVTGYPARKLGPLLEGCIAFAEKIGFRHTHLFQCRTHRRPGTFPDADRADGIALYQRDPDTMPVLRAVARGDDPGREPSCRAPAHDANRSNHMRHGQFPRGQAETRIELPGTMACVPGNPCGSSKACSKTHHEPSPAILGREEMILITGVFDQEGISHVN